MKNLHSQLRSPSSASANGHVIYRKTILHNTPVLKNTPELQISDMPFNKVWTLTTTTPSISPTLSKTAPPITRPLLSKTALPTTSPIIISWKGMEPRVYDVSCDETVCPPDSFCSNDYDSGGSRCHCNLGHRGNLCSEGDMLFYVTCSIPLLFLYVCMCMTHVCFPHRCVDTVSKVLRIFSHDF